MRKVTASAVILTALSGCNQSGGVPSSQWSFKAPAGDQASSIQESVQNAGANSHSSRLAGLQLSADAQPFVDISSQRSHKAATGSSDLTSSDLMSAAVGSTRPDPVAQARAYLRNSTAPNAVISRAPNRVVTTYSPAYQSVLPASQSGSVSVLPPDQGSLANLTSSATTSREPQPASGSFAFVSPVAALAPAPTATFNLSASNSSPVPNADYPSTANADYPSPTRDGLPQLVPSPAVPVGSSTQAEPEIPIGTAILNNLQRSASRTADLPVAVESLSVESPTDLSAPTASEIPAASAAPVAVLNSAAVSTALADRSEPAEQLSDSATTPFAAPLNAPANSEAQSPPTLARLLRTLPSREASPLVISARDLQSPSSSSSDLSADSATSPLLSGLEQARLSSEIYVPIVEAAPVNEATTLVPTTFFQGRELSADPSSKLNSIEWGDAFPTKALIKLNQQSSSRRQIVRWQ